MITKILFCHLRFNSLYIWVPDLINSMVIEGETGKTVCQVRDSKKNQVGIAQIHFYILFKIHQKSV